MEITGKVLEKLEAKQISETFKVQEFIADCGTMNQMQEWKENILPFQVSNANIEVLASIPVGSIVKITFFPKGRYYEKRDNAGKGVAFNMDAYKLDVLKKPEPAEPQAAATTGTTHY